MPPQRNQTRVSLGGILTWAQAIQISFILRGIYYEREMQHTSIFHLVLLTSSSQSAVQMLLPSHGCTRRRLSCPRSPAAPGSGAGQCGQVPRAGPWPGQRQQNGPYQTLLPHIRYRNAVDNDAITPGPRPQRLPQMSPSGATASEHWEVTTQK